MSDHRKKYEKYDDSLLKGTIFEGMEPEYIGDSPIYPPVLFPGWQKRMRGRHKHSCLAMPEAVIVEGRIIPRLKNRADVTYQDVVNAGLKGVYYARILLSQDREPRHACDYH